MNTNKDRLQMYLSLTKITIVLCWLSLFSFWAIKLFGGNWFEIMVENENFLKFSNMVQNTWLKYLVSFITIFIARYLVFCSICQKFTFKGKQLIYIILLILSVWIVVNFIKIEIIQMLYVYVIMVVMGIVCQNGWRKLYGLLAIAFEFIFTSISMITRNVKLQFVTEYLVIMILMIDIYIMFALYYLYSNLLKITKENNNMALLLGGGWLSKEDAQKNGYTAWKRFWHNIGYGFRYVVTFKWLKKSK